MDESAPDEYRFSVGARSGVVLALQDDGRVVVSDEAGGMIATIAAPWAVDAEGRELPTHYRVEGDTIIQVIETEGATYPVVADPYIDRDCGDWKTPTCTWRFDRTTTKNLRTVSAVLGIMAGACSFVGPIAVFCAAAVVPASGLLAIAASNYYEDGDCLGVRTLKTGGPFWFTRVQRHTYNCYKHG